MLAAIRNLRNKPDVFFIRLPNILSFLCIIVGVVWLLLLPLNDYSRQTYISENALLPGQVHAYFTGSEQNIFRGYKKELEVLLNEGREDGVSSDEVAVTPAYADRKEQHIGTYLILKQGSQQGSINPASHGVEGCDSEIRVHLGGHHPPGREHLWYYSCTARRCHRGNCASRSMEDRK